MLWKFLSILPTLKYYGNQGLNEKLKLIGDGWGGVEGWAWNIQRYGPLSYKILFEKFVKSSGSPSYILNVQSLNAHVVFAGVSLDKFSMDGSMNFGTKKVWNKEVIRRRFDFPFRVHSFFGETKVELCKSYL